MHTNQSRVALAVVAAAGLAASAHAGIVPIAQSYQMAGEASVSSKALGGDDAQSFELGDVLSIEKPSEGPSVLKNGHAQAAYLPGKTHDLYASAGGGAYTLAGVDNLLVESTSEGTMSGLWAKHDHAHFVAKGTATIEFHVTSPIAVELSGWIDAMPSMGKEGPFGFARWASLSLSNEKGLLHTMSSDDKGFEGATKFSEMTKLDVGTYRLEVASYVEGSELEAWEEGDAFAGARVGLTVVPTPATAALALIGIATMARRRRA